MFSKTWCPFCVNAQTILKKKFGQISVLELDKITDETKREALEKAVNKKTGSTSVPQIFVNGEKIGGYDDLMAATKDGSLALKVANID